ncbi:carboxymuconolactone decarboxylase family protein [Pseudomonas fluorescens]|nr:carboxymuconolactone decarboxylase family protein [Pseudomonas fluorescens]
MTKLDDKAERGLEILRDMAGSTFAEQMRGIAESDGFGADLGRMALHYAFADAWGHEGLDRKSKSIAIISALIAMRQPKELKNHVKIGLANGLDIQDFEALLVQLTPYVGLPASASATSEIIEALRESGRDPAVRTAEERGLL